MVFYFSAADPYKTDYVKELKYCANHLSHKKERKAIKSLATNSDIIIKPADKGGAIVIQDKCNYIAECQRQLSNETHHKQLTSDPTQELNNKILRTLQTAVH